MFTSTSLGQSIEPFVSFEPNGAMKSRFPSNSIPPRRFAGDRNVVTPSTRLPLAQTSPSPFPCRRHPLIPVVAMPCTKSFWAKKKTTRQGRTVTTEAAISQFQEVVFTSWNMRRPIDSTYFDWLFR
jgi:hypothetical protein